MYGNVFTVFFVAVTEGRDVRVAERMTDVVMQELSGQQRTLHGRTTTVTVLGKPKVTNSSHFLLQYVDSSCISLWLGPVIRLKDSSV